jgi:hypothetical protein
MRDPQHLKTLQASTACHGDSLTLLNVTLLKYTNVNLSLGTSIPLSVWQICYVFFSVKKTGSRFPSGSKNFSFAHRPNRQPPIQLVSVAPSRGGEADHSPTQSRG